MPKKSRANAGGKAHAQKLSQAEARLRALEWLRDQVAFNHRSWSAKNPMGTLRDLASRLKRALRQCQEIMECCEDDMHISEHPCIPEPLATELDEWDNDDEECTFSYREPNLEDMLAFVEDLAEKVGYDFRVSELKGWQPK